MPFTVRDAHRHKHGLSARQARQWVHVANGHMQSCLADGGTDATCAPVAIRMANGVVGEPATPTTERYLTIQTALTVPPSRLTVNDCEYLTAPAVLAVCGVLNGGLLREEAIVPDAWNAVPILINHPTGSAGEPLSGRSPEIMAHYGVGHVYRARHGIGYRQGNAVPSLQAELWLDVAQCTRLGGEALQAMERIEAEQPCEVSTAFYPDAVREAGSFYGTPYTEVYYAVRPDHLALLPNGIGACSWENGGCGCPRLNHADASCACTAPYCTCRPGDTPMDDALPVRGWRAFLQALRQFVAREDAALTTAETPPPTDPGPPVEEDDEALVTAQTVGDVQEALYGALAREMGVNMTPFYIDAGAIDLANQHFIYRCGERLCRRYWTLVDGVVTLTDLMEDVQRDTTFLAVPNTTGSAEERNPMPMAAAPSVIIKSHVQRLIANGAVTGWTEPDRHLLEQMDEATLIRLQHQPQVPPSVERQEPTTLEDALQYVPAQFRETLSNATQAYTKRKTKLIEVILANAQNPFARPELEGMTADRLEQIVVMAGEEIPDIAARPQAQSYSGRRIPQIRVVTDAEDTVPPPPKTMELVVERRRQLGLMA